MTDVERSSLVSVSRLLEYPDEAFFAAIPDIRTVLQESADCPQKDAMLDFLEKLETAGLQASQEEYVSVFDQDPESSLYLTWHRYGNDRSQGQAMAALNGLYRSAGMEPIRGTMPDYLPRVLEFLAVCEDWAAEVIVDGFGPEMVKMLDHLTEIDSSHALMLRAALDPLRQKWPDHFKPRASADSTMRPFASPEPECGLPELLRQPRKKTNTGGAASTPPDTGA